MPTAGYSRSVSRDGRRWGGRAERVVHGPSSASQVRPPVGHGGSCGGVGEACDCGGKDGTFRQDPPLGAAYLLTGYITGRRAARLSCDRMHYGQDRETIDLIFRGCASSSSLVCPGRLLCAVLSKDPHLPYARSPDAWRGAALKRGQLMDAIPLVSHHSFRGFQPVC